VLLGVDDMDIFKGISLKLLAMEQLLYQHPQLVGKLVMVQILNPARGRGRDVLEVQEEISVTTERINELFGSERYQPVELMQRHVPLYERVAYYTIAECCVVSAVRDGMNLIPYEYIVCRQGITELDARFGITPDSPKESMLVVSEFIGCSPSLSGAICVNPWNIEALADAMNTSITMPDGEKQMRHEKHVSTHDVAFWAQSFIGDLQRTCKEHSRSRCYRLGFGLGFRVVRLDYNFRKLSTEHIEIRKQCFDKP
jgi:trehalose 6-phosphate synthase/phosphatase